LRKQWQAQGESEMKAFVMSASTLGAMMIGSAAIAAQTTAPMTPTPAPTSTPSTAPSTSTMPQAAPAPATPLTSADINDSEVGQFATAVVAVNKIQQDTTVADADKQSKMAAAVTGSGLTPQRFNQIAKASQSDPALMTRIQTAAAKQMKDAPPAK
jgi:hypothetical protein